MKRITRKELRGLYEPAPQSLYDNVHEALAGLPEGKGKRKVKKKISTGFIMAAALLALSAVGFAATRLNLFSHMDRYANPIKPLEGAETLVVENLASTENEWVTVTVEEAAYDGQGVMVLARITPKDTEKYALFNDMLMDTPKDEYEIEAIQDGPRAIEDPYLQFTYYNEKDEQNVEIINEENHKQLLIDSAEVPLPESLDEALESGILPVYLEDNILYWADSSSYAKVTRRDGKEILGFEPVLYPQGEGACSLTDGMTSDAEAQSDGSVLVWCDGYAEEPLPDALDLNLHVTLWVEDDMRSLDIPFTLVKGEAERTARYVPEGDGWIGDHVKVRQVNVSLTKVRAYLTVDYDYEEQPNEPMGVWLHPYDAEGNAITTGSGSGGGPGDEDELGFYRQREEMQSFDEMLDGIVLEAKVIGGDSLGQCVCRLAKPE